MNVIINNFIFQRIRLQEENDKIKRKTSNKITSFAVTTEVILLTFQRYL